MTANSRYQFKDHWKGIVEWIMGDYSAQLLAPFTRDVFEQCDDYKCAYDAFSETQLVTPVFLILANGAAPGNLHLSFMFHSLTSKTIPQREPLLPAGVKAWTASWSLTQKLLTQTNQEAGTWLKRTRNQTRRRHFGIDVGNQRLNA